MVTTQIQSGRAAPFYMRRGPVGCLLLHGYTDGPASLRGLGERLAGAGVTVRCDLLPGHGTVPSELNTLHWRDWWETVLAGYGALEKECRMVFVAGLSFGGTLALHLASHRSVAGLITLGGMLGTVNPWARWAGWMKYIRPLVPKEGGSDIRDDTAKSRHIAYDCTPLGGLAEALNLVDHVREDLHLIRCPVLVAHGAFDHTIPLANAHEIMAEVSSPRRQLLVLPQSYHVITVDLEHEQLEEAVVAFITSVSEQESDKSF